ncbi:MAG: OsmC family protein [Nitrospirae bacterium]|nr:OsmC family protein [Nitrospirota bacterium]
MAKAKVTLVDAMQFIGTADSGHAVIMDAPVSSGGTNTGSKPMELLLMAFGGCSGMDVISILRKKKLHVTKFETHVEGRAADDYPHMYTALHIEYVVTGKDIPEDAVKRAIDLSLDKYCSVGATLGKAAKITHSYKVIQE